MSPEHKRFNEKSITRLENFNNKLPFFVEELDFQESNDCYPDALHYYDPPYKKGNALYGRNGDIHKEFDHQGFCDLIKPRKNWILSYNDCSEIRSMYKGFYFATPEWKYGMTKNKNSNELIIISDDL